MDGVFDPTTRDRRRDEPLLIVSGDADPVGPARELAERRIEVVFLAVEQQVQMLAVAGTDGHVGSYGVVAAASDR